MTHVLSVQEELEQLEQVEANAERADGCDDAGESEMSPTSADEYDEYDDAGESDDTGDSGSACSDGACSDGNAIGPQRECISLDRQVWEHPQTNREKNYRILKLMDLDRVALEVENVELYKRLASEKMRRIAAEEAAQRVLERAEQQRKETFQTAVLFRECLQKLIVDRPELPDDVKEAYENLRFLPLPGEGPELEFSEAGGSSCSTDPVHSEEEALEKPALIPLVMQLQETLDRALLPAKSERKPSEAVPRPSAGALTNEQMRVREPQTVVGSAQGVFRELFTGWSFSHTTVEEVET